MVAIHLTFQYRPDTGDYGGKIGPTILQTITVYLMAYTGPKNRLQPHITICTQQHKKTFFKALKSFEK